VRGGHHHWQGNIQTRPGWLLALRKSRNLRSNWTLRSAVRMYTGNRKQLDHKVQKRRGVELCGTMVVEEDMGSSGGGSNWQP
jgi:hypothetical protein